jgi:hypothetical protein
VQNFKVGDGQAILTTALDFDTDFTNDDILGFISDTAGIFGEQVHADCLFEDLGCGSFSVNANLLGGRKRATEKFTVEWIFTNTGPDSGSGVSGVFGSAFFTFMAFAMVALLMA